MEREQKRMRVERSNDADETNLNVGDAVRGGSKGVEREYIAVSECVSDHAGHNMGVSARGGLGQKNVRVYLHQQYRPCRRGGRHDRIAA